MIIDVFTHLLPTPVFERMNAIAPDLADVGKRVRNLRPLWDLDSRFRAMDGFGDYRQIVCLPNPPLEDFVPLAVGPELARIANDSMAEIVARHKDRFAGFVAALYMKDVAASLAEIERAIVTLGASGIQVFSNVDGRPLDEAEFAPLFDAVARHDLPVWLHPARTADHADYRSETRSRFDAWSRFGWPYETSVAMYRLVLSGVFDRNPSIKIITHHCGAMVPMFESRIARGFATAGTRSSDEDYVGRVAALARPPMEYFHLFYGDTALSGGSIGLKCGLEFFGADHIVFATDAPFMPVRTPMDAFDSLALDAATKRKIQLTNAERLLGRKLA